MVQEKIYSRDILKPYAAYVEQSAHKIRTYFNATKPARPIGRKILVDGPVAGTYSLAIVNRHFSLELMRLGFDVYLTQNEGPDPQTDIYFQSYPELAEKYISRERVPSLSFDIHTKNDWPIQASPRLAPVLTAHCYAWEESIFPVSVASELEKFDAIFCTSQYTIDALRCSGYTKPTFYVGNGVEHIEPTNNRAAPKSPRDSRRVHFVHVSSGLPRKGMREGLAAFLEEFRDVDDVHLTIKTHHSFDNELYELVDNLDPTERSKVTFDDSYMSSVAIRDLIASADCCFLPSHGEGFCLPAAEAMRLRTLVCTTDSGGNREFCTPETCILIPTRFVPSQSAIGQGRSAWLQASRSDLRAGLRRAYALSKRSDHSLQRRAYHRIKKFTWLQAAKKFVAGVNALSTGAQPLKNGLSKQRICLISTFNQRCGIATYSAALQDAMEKAGSAPSVIITEDIAKSLCTKADDSKIIRLWDRTSESIDKLIRYAQSHEIGSTFIIQHHPAIFSWNDLTKLCDGLKEFSNDIAIELHSTDGKIHQLESFVMKISPYAKIVVHNNIDYLKVVAQSSSADRIFLFPHPTSVHQGRLLQPKHKFSLFTFGFCCPHKRFEDAFAIAHELKLRHHDVKLRVFTAIDGSVQKNIEYSNFLYNLRDQLGLRKEIDLEFGFKPISDVLAASREATVALFCYADLSEGGSGAVRVPLSCGVPTITSRSSIFSDLAGICHQIDTHETVSAADHIEDLVSDAGKRKKLIDKQSDYINFSTWGNHSSRMIGILDGGHSKNTAAPAHILNQKTIPLEQISA